MSDGSQGLIVPIYYNSPANQLEIYVSLNGGPAEPYSFDTGAPNLFATYGSWWPGTSETDTEGSSVFTFAQEPTFYYNTVTTSVTLSDVTGATLATATKVNVAQITNVAVYGNGVTAAQDYQNWALSILGTPTLSNGTFGDFGAGLYGTSTLGTVLAQIPVSSGLEAGFIVEAPQSDATPGAVIVGLSGATIAAWKADPDTITLTMTSSGTLPNPDGTTAWSSYGKAQASDTVVTLTSGSETISFDIGLVVDTDGGLSNNIYTTGDISLPGWATGVLDGIGYTLSSVSSGGSSSTVLSYTTSSGALYLSGKTEVLGTKTSDTDRDNPGYNLFLSYTVMFDVADGTLLLRPITHEVVSGGGAIVSGGSALSQSDTLLVDQGGTAVSFTLSSVAVATVSGVLEESVLDGGYAVILSAGLAQGGRVESGGSELVSSGGSAEGALLSAGGWQIIETGGRTTATTVANGGTELVSSGGTSLGATVSSGGALLVDAGGTASGSVLSAGGYEIISSGGTALATTVSSGGTLLLADGVASGTVLSGGSVISTGVVEVSGSSVTAEGNTLSGASLVAGDTGFILSGGTLSDSTLSGGSVIIFGDAQGNILSGNAQEQVFGRSEQETLVTARQSVHAGGTAVSASLVSGAVQAVLSGGHASASQVSSGGYLLLSRGGESEAAVLSTGGGAIVASGGTADQTIVLSGGLETVMAQGLASASQISAGGAEVILGGTEAGGLIRAGGAVLVSTGLFTGGTVASGGLLEVEGGGVTESGTIAAGGYAIISAGALASAVTVEEGGALILFGGSESGITGAGSVISSGIVLETSGAAGFAVSVSGGGLSGLAVESGTQGFVLASTTISDTHIEGGILTVEGETLSGRILEGGSEVILSGGVASGIYVSAGVQSILAGGLAWGTILGSAAGSGSSGGSGSSAGSGGSAGTALVGSGGTAILANIESGLLVVSYGGLASGTVVHAGSDILISGATAVLTHIAGGTEVVSYGGQSEEAVINGGEQLVSYGGFTSDTIIDIGYQLISNNGIARDTMISGGSQVVTQAGIAGHTTILSGGTQVVQDYGSALDTTISSGGTLIISAGGSAVNSLDFAGDSATLVLGGNTASVAVISGFTAGDSILLSGLTYTSAGSASFADGSLTVVENGDSASLSFAGDYASADFLLSEAAGGAGTLISLACFAQGTRIMTAAGDVAVEDLRAGDSVRTVAGDDCPIIWRGARHVDCTGHPDPAKVWPVRVAAGAFGPGLPVRPLWLSPDHAVYAEGILIPIKHLINGASIRQEQVAQVTYLHIELAQHDVVLAEGLPAETYLDSGDRQSFAGSVTSLHPAWGSEHSDVSLVFDSLGYAPLRVTGPEVERVRAGLAARASESPRHFTAPAVMPAMRRRWNRK